MDSGQARIPPRVPSAHVGRMGGAWLGLGVVLGWLFCDLALFLRGGEIGLVLERLLPASLGALGAGALLGAALAGRRRAQTVLAVLMIGASRAMIAQTLYPHGHPGYLLGSVGAMVAAFGLAEWARARRDPGAVRLGVATGALACAVAARVHFGAWALPPEVAVPGALALLFGLLPGAARVVGACAALVLGLALVQRNATRAADLGPPGLPGPPAGTASGPNVVLIVMDTVRADHLSCYGYRRKTTPGLEAFARDEATTYTKARSTGPFTLTSHASLLTGLFPGEHGASVGGQASRPLCRDVPTLGERFAGAGYRSGAIVANTPYLNRSLGFDRGFHHFDARAGTDVKPHRALVQLLGIPRLGHVQRDAERITELALEWIEEGGARPFFLMLNYLDAHAPLTPPRACIDALLEPGRRLGELSFEEQHVLLYDSEILYMDGWLTRFREGLREAGIYDDTLLVITSDHGHAFGDHGHWEHCWMLYEEQLRVPLLVKPARGRRQAIEERPTSGVDVHDLLLAEASLGVPARAARPEGLTGEWYPWPLRERICGCRRACSATSPGARSPGCEGRSRRSCTPTARSRPTTWIAIRARRFRWNSRQKSANGPGRRPSNGGRPIPSKPARRRRSTRSSCAS